MKGRKDYKFFVSVAEAGNKTLHQGRCGIGAKTKEWTGYDNYGDIPEGIWNCRTCRPYWLKEEQGYGNDTRIWQDLA